MTRYFTHYWKIKTAKDVIARLTPEDNVLTHTAGNQFRRANVQPGDHIYVVTNDNGSLAVVAAMKIEKILTKTDAAKHFGSPISELWDAAEHLVSSPKHASPIKLEKVAPEDIADLRFIAGGKEKVLKISEDGSLDNQTARGVRELTIDSALLLDEYLLKPNQKELATDYIQQRLKALEGESNIDAHVKARREQRLLREYLFGSTNAANCAICNRKYPVNLLACAHIKRRADCSELERVDPRVVMAACKLGCDELYEQAYIYVNQTGKICRNERISNQTTKAVSDCVKPLVGRKCSAWDGATTAYFRAHEAQLNQGRLV